MKFILVLIVGASIAIIPAPVAAADFQICASMNGGMNGGQACLPTEVLRVNSAAREISAASGLDEFKNSINRNLKVEVLEKIAEQADKVKRKVSLGKCWLMTWGHLASSGIAKERGSNPARLGKDVVKELQSPNLKFVNLLDPGQLMHNIPNPCLAPRGAILVYEGGPMVPGSEPCRSIRCGHTETKTGGIGNGAVASDYASSEPLSGCEANGPGPNNFRSADRAKLIGIMVPPEAIRSR